MSLFCLVHGSYQGAWCWDLLIPELEARGHQAVAMDLPIDEPSAGAARFAEVVVQTLQGADDDVVLVGNSMSGLVIPIVANQRPVRRLVFLAALIPQVGISAIDQFYDEIDPDALKAVGYEPPKASIIDQFREEPDVCNPALLSQKEQPSQSEAVAIEFLLHDCEPDVIRWAIPKLRTQQAMNHMFEISPLQSWPDVESAYILCTEDRAISPTWSRYAAHHRLGVDPIELPGGHWPHLSRPAHLADVLTKEQV